jgi:GT2 family glycosyltransferase
MEPDLSVCIIAASRNVLNLIRTVQETADPVSVEIIVVVGSSSGSISEDIDRQFPETLLFENDPGEKFGCAANRALRLARGRYLALFDETVTVENGCLYRLLRFLDDNPETGIAVPVLTNNNGALFVNARPLPGILGIVLHHLGFDGRVPGGPWMGSKTSLALAPVGTRERSVQWAGFDAMVIRREVVEEVGYLGKRFNSEYAAAEFCLRTQRRGWHVYQVPAAVAGRHGETPPCPGFSAEADACRYLSARWFGSR